MTEEIALPEIEEVEEALFDFSEEFQSKITALVMRDTVFNQRTEGLVKPNYFTNLAEGAIVNIVLKYYAKYKLAPNLSVMVNLFKDARAKKEIREDLEKSMIAKIAELSKVDISDRDYTIDKVVEFAQHQALENAIVESVDLLKKGRFDQIKKLISEACDVGVSADNQAYDYFAEIEHRTQKRKEEVSGAVRPTGITTGVPKFDDLLYHKGWGRRELSVIMGGAKSGKTTALLDFARAAAFAGYKVIYISLEVSNGIMADRLDSNISETELSKIREHIMDIDKKIRDKQPKGGLLHFFEYPTGTMKPSDLRRLISRYRAKGTIFDLVVVDYADIMAPEFRTDSNIENSKSIYVDLRAIAQMEGFAVLTATQTNRDGHKSVVAKATDIADDFNKVRIADLLISINATPEERADKEARLYFAASRNQRGEFTVKIQQDLERMKFLTKVLDIE